MLGSYSTVQSQFTIGVSIGGIGFHPIDDGNDVFYKWKLDKRGRFVGFAGMSIIASYRFNDYIGIKFTQSLIFHDCAGKFAGVTHLGIDLHDDIVGWTNPKNQFSMSVGPFFYYRKYWNKEPLYTHDPKFIKAYRGGDWEMKFVIHGGQIEYNHYFNDTTSFAFNFLPGYPFLYTFGLGGRYTAP